MKNLFFALAFLFVGSIGFAGNTENIKPKNLISEEINLIANSIINYESLIKDYNSTFKNDEDISFTLIFDYTKCYISFCYRENGEWNCSPWQEVPCEVKTEDLILESEKIE